MLTLYKYEGKTEDEAKKNCLDDLQVSIDDIYVTINEESARLFKSKKVILEVLKKDDVIRYVKDYIKEFALKFAIDINSEVNISDDIISIVLVSNNNSILIGKDGRTLEALQVILKQSILSATNKYFKVHIDASNYKANKQKNLEYEIKKIAKDVLNSKIEVKLDPMNSYDRRCVHNVIATFENLKSTSYGESPERYIVISYKED